MSDERQSRTVGQAVSETDTVTAACYIALALIIIGSIGPWITSPLVSKAGTDGDGIITIILAALGLLALWRIGRKPITLPAIAAVLIGAVGIYDLADIQNRAAKVTLFGTQLAHVGWGVYMVIAGAVLLLGALVYGRSH